ncbi:MAG TPA: serine/threonine-protein kinase, partial [Polyangiaceae bacterium]|nr:serine/threonine-protein kinase [Polyangiaceae bacterium]
PATVRVFDYGKTAEGDPYIVMELLEGEDLMSIINRRERLSPIKAVRVLLPVIRALGMAHAHGIVHRDLKPENIFLARLPDGRVQPKLLDFGIAKLKDASDLRLTSAGSVVGSPLYMAPEQARGEDVDERADIWALAVVLYEAIAGQPPFGGDDRIQVALAVANHTPEMPRDCGIDAVLWGYLQRGLAKSKEERWPSVDELGRALARWLIDNGVTDDITGASLESGWLRRSRRSLFASSLPPERKSQQGPPSSWQERARGAWSLLIARGEPVRAGWAGLPRAARWGLLGGGVLSVVCVLLLSLGKHDVPAAAQNTTREVPPEAAVPVVESATPPAAASENANASATSTLPAPEPPQPIEPARANSDSAHKAKHASARKRAATKNDSVHDPGRRERRAKLIDPYQ